MSKTKPLELVPFVNELEQEILPNENVIIITVRQRVVRIKSGRYVGLRKNPGWNNEEYTSVSVEIDEVHKKFLHKETGEEWTGKVDIEYPTLPPAYYERRYIDYYGYRDVLDKDVKASMRAEYDKKKKIYDDAVAKLREQYHYVDFPYVRKSTLQLNRIFPINTPVKSLAGQRF